MKNKKVWLIFLILLLVSCGKQNSVLIDNGDEKIRISIEAADNPEERSKGLMFRSSLEKNSGMLFVFDNENYHSFWMKNTLIPLDLIFISEGLEIVDIKYMEPCREDPCQSYRPIRPAKYVLEVNGNFTTKNDIKIGNKIKIQ